MFLYMKASDIIQLPRQTIHNPESAERTIAELVASMNNVGWTDSILRIVDGTIVSGTLRAIAIERSTLPRDTMIQVIVEITFFGTVFNVIKGAN